MHDDIEARTIRSVTLRTIPILFTMLFFSYLDRVNVGFAALRMNQDLGFSASIFGFGAGVFFVGYALLEVPSNLMLHRLGARRWFCIILVTWGGIAAAMALTRGPLSFYAFRFVLGLAEGGLMPGVIYYLTSWFPAAHRARANAKYIIAGTLAPTIGAPISGLLLTGFDGVAGLPGWQWMFILEGIPTALLGFVVLALLPDRPEAAPFLDPAERGWLVAELAAERQGLEQTRHYSLLDVARNGKVWQLSVMFACTLTSLYGLLLWLPQIVKSLGGLSTLQVSLVSGGPFLCGVAGTLILSRLSDRAGERKRHLAAASFLGAVGLVGSALSTNPYLAYAFLCVAGAGIWGGLGVFWTIVGSFMTGVAAAAGIALINTLAQVGGLVGPWFIGLIRDWTGSFTAALLAMSGFTLAAALIALTLEDRPVRRALPSVGLHGTAPQ